MMEIALISQANQSDDSSDLLIIVILVVVVVLWLKSRSSKKRKKTNLNRRTRRVRSGSPSPSSWEEDFVIRSVTFTVRYEKDDAGCFTIYIIDRPPNIRSDSPPLVHMYSDGRVSVDEGREPETLDDARAIARYWARGYLKYQRTGVFPNDGGKVNV